MDGHLCIMQLMLVMLKPLQFFLELVLVLAATQTNKGPLFILQHSITILT